MEVITPKLEDLIMETVAAYREQVYNNPHQYVERVDCMDMYNIIVCAVKELATGSKRFTAGNCHIGMEPSGMGCSVHCLPTPPIVRQPL